ncbi:MAG: ABC transporter permease, partial [Rhodococcus qingshengii]
MNIGAIGKKLGQLVIVILIVSFGTFVLASLIPGDPAVSVLGEGRTPAGYEEVRQQLGLNDPLLVRYWDWLTSAL